MENFLKFYKENFPTMKDLNSCFFIGALILLNVVFWLAVADVMYSYKFNMFNFFVIYGLIVFPVAIPVNCYLVNTFFTNKNKDKK